MSNVPAVNDQTFDQEVVSSATPVLVDFYATWCGPCQVLAPVVDQISQELSGKLKVVKVDIDEAQDATSNNGVTSVPTLVVFKGGKEVYRRVGAAPKRALMEELQKVL
jgi:thioredoxin 1